MTKIRVAPTGDDKLDLRRLLDDQGNADDLDVFGDLLFKGIGSGLCFGQISVVDNTTPTVISGTGEANKVRFMNFDTNGPENGVVANADDNQLEILEDGYYIIVVMNHADKQAGTAATFGFRAYKNGGQQTCEGVHAHQRFTGGAGDVQAIPLGGLALLDKGDKIELWLWNNTNTNNIIIEDSTFFAVCIGR